jgi:hypothetical protein
MRPLAAAAGVVLLIAGCGASRRPDPSTSGGIPAALLREARPVGRGARFQPPATGPVIGPCKHRLGTRFGVHVEVFAANKVLLLPSGIGTRAPRAYDAGRIVRAACYGGLVTIDPTGLVLVRPGLHLLLADLFRSWGEALSSSRLTSFQASARKRVSVFVDGRAWNGRPGGIPLKRHAEIVLEVGPHVPAHARYTFPPST